MSGPVANLVVLRCADPGRAAEFYEQMGIHFDQHRHGSGPMHYAAEMPGFTFELYPQGGGASSSATRIGFSVASVDATVAALNEEYPDALVSAAKDSPWGRRAIVKDPDGHKVELSERP